MQTTITAGTATTEAAHVTPTGTSQPLLRSGAKAVGLALLAVMSTYLLARTFGSDLLVAGPGGSSVEVTPGSIAGMTVFGGTVAVALTWAFGRWAPKPRAAFLTTTLVGLAAYAAVPFAAAESATTALWLNAFHLAVAMPVLTTLGRRLPKERTSGRA